MKDVANLNNSKVPAVRINPALDSYTDRILFPEKLAKAEAMLKNAKLPTRKSAKS